MRRWSPRLALGVAALLASDVSAAPPAGDPPSVQRVQRPTASTPKGPEAPPTLGGGPGDPLGAPGLPNSAAAPLAPPPQSEAWKPPATDLFDPDEEKAEGEDAGAWRPPAGVPGSGLPREAGQGDSRFLVTPLPVRARNEAEAAALEELEGIAQRYRRVAQETEETLQTLLVIEAQAGKKALGERYTKSIDQRMARARSLRAKAITRYREFLELHPNDAAWTPEITFRLAELNYESANERLRRKDDAWEKELAAYEERQAKGQEVGDMPPSPKVDYTAAVENFRRVARDFPKYVHGDAARYMMGLLLYEQEQFDAGRQSLLALTCADRYEVPDADGVNVIPSVGLKQSDYQGCTPLDPESGFLTEAWLRIGEIHYDVDELGPALQAYTEASKDPESRFYHAALIRLAWTLYLRREFAPAAGRFDEFVLFADSVKGTSRGSGAAEFRDEAIRYLAKCYVEEDWDRDGNRDRVRGVKRLDRDYRARWDEPHVPEIYAALGDVWAEADDLAFAVNLWERVLKKWPNAARAPRIQMKLFEAYNQLQERDRARAARDALATSYLRGTAWHYANESDVDALEEAMGLAEDALVAVAVDHHERAQSFRVAGDPKAKGEYEIASRAYAAYLERFPNTDASYEYRFQYADTLFYGQHYLEAASQFVAVRDSNLDNRLQADASESVLASLESYLEEEADKGRFSLPEMPKQGAPGPFGALALPAVVVALQEAYDQHAGIRADGEATPQIKFKAAALSQRYNNFSDAEGRFVAILEQHCKHNVSINAGYAIIDAHVVQGDLEGTREWTEKLAGMGCGEGEEGAKFAGELKTIGNAVRFKEASLLFDAGEFEAAADRYVALVDEAPDDPNADRALNNAAVAYEEIGRFASASQTYERIYTNYADSEFADDALLRSGLNHARFFEFEEAVRSYLRLAEDERYEKSEFRETALKNAANLLDGLQQYPRAAELYAAYAKKVEAEGDKAEALFRAAKILGKTSDHRRTIKAYQSYLKTYQSVPGEAERVVESWLRIGIAQAELGSRKKAEDAYRQSVGIFQSAGLKSATDAADLASEAQFRLAEYSLQDVLSVKLTGTGKKFERQAKQLFDRVLISSTEYDAVFPFRRIEWVLAAMFRRGYAFETVAQKVRAAPVPKQLKEGTEPWFAYKELVAKQMEAFENKAVMLYEETVKRSREFRISNEWTQRARERLNVYKPDDYPLLRPAAVDLNVEDRR